MNRYWQLFKLLYKSNVENRMFFSFLVLFSMVTTYFFQNYLSLINQNYINWIESVISPVVGNTHFLMLFFSPALMYLLFANFYRNETRFFCRFLNLHYNYCLFINYLVSLLMVGILLITFLPLGFYLKHLGFGDSTYLFNSIFSIFLVTSVFCSINTYILSFTRNPLIYAFLCLVSISFFYLIGLISNYTDHYLLVRVLRFLSFSVFFDDVLTGIVSIKKIIYLISLNIFFFSLIIFSNKRNIQEKEVSL